MNQGDNRALPPYGTPAVQRESIGKKMAERGMISGAVAARLLGFDRKTVYNAAKAGKLSVERIGARQYVSIDSLIAHFGNSDPASEARVAEILRAVPIDGDETL